MRLRSVLALAAMLLCGGVLERTEAAPAAPVSTPAYVVPIDGAAGTWRVRPTANSTNVHRVSGSTQASTHGTSLGSSSRASSWSTRASSWSTNDAGRWRPPEVTIRGLLGGASADGAALALIPSPSPGGNGSSRFAVVRRTGLQTVELRGSWSFDALSVDGRTLFLTESIGSGKYWVRAVNVATGRAGDPLVTKSITPTSVEVDDGPMQGLPIDRVVSADGVTVYTLYDGPTYPFIHALNVAVGGALCYELIGMPDVSPSRLRLRFDSAQTNVEVRDGSVTLAQIWLPSSPYGPSVRIAGTANAPR